MATTTTRAARPEQRPAPEQEQPEQRPDGQLLDRVIEQTVDRIDARASEYALAIREAHGRLKRAVLLARGIQELRKAVLPLMPEILPLMNTRLGFLTDRDPKRPGKDGRPQQPYRPEDVADVVVEAMLRGLRLTGNEWNIIAHGCYTTQEGYERLVRELPGLTDLDLSCSVPRVSAGGAVVRVRASWRLRGVPQELRDEQGQPGLSVAVRLNAGMGADAAIGKARRKCLKVIHQRVTGSESSGEEDDAAVVTEAPALPAAAAPIPAGGATREHLQDLRELTQGMEEAEALALLPEGVTRFEHLTPEQAAAIIDRLCAGRESANAGADG